jgi:formylglycine-generating enzyme required for sulfatase activity
VWEWCEDDWQENYINTPINGTALISLRKRNMLRGGSWRDFPDCCRSAFRGSNNLDVNSYEIGFRVVCSGAARNL